LTPIRKLEAAVVEALEDVKARDIRVYDVAHLSSLFDRVIIASAESNRQLRALASSVREKTKAAGGRVYGVEGEESGEWVLVDLGDVVVHIMQPAVRTHYNLEELWDQPKPRPVRRTAARAKRPAGTRKPRKPA
jgi:ribosome-associated protein